MNDYAVANTEKPTITAEEVNKQLSEAVIATHKAVAMSDDARQAERHAIECWNRYHEMQETLFGMMGQYAGFNNSKFGPHAPRPAGLPR